jgi:ABC-type nitrate/sulfonate/bicarbonate transport system substrate-binding protein
MLKRYFKETEATAQTKEDFKNIYKDLQKKYPRAFIEGQTWAMQNPTEAQEITDTINNFLQNR